MSRAHRPSPCCNRRSNAIRVDLDRGFMLAACAICGKEFVSRLKAPAGGPARPYDPKTSEACVLAQNLDAIEDEDTRAVTMAACLHLIFKAVQHRPAAPARVQRENVIELFPSGES